MPRKGQGGVRITNMHFIYSPRPRFASATPLINKGGKAVLQNTPIYNLNHYISMILFLPPQCKCKIFVHKFGETLYKLFTRLWKNTL